MAVALSACGLGDNVVNAQGDPCGLLTTSEIQEATGQATEAGVRSRNVCEWSTEGGGRFSAAIFGGGDGLFESAVRSEGGVRVSGVADKASYLGNTQLAFIQVLEGSTNMRLDYSGPSAPDEAKMTALARAAVPRL